MLAFGIISEVYPDKGTARVRFPDLDNMVSQPLPMMSAKTLQDKFSIPFDTNEHVCCLMDETLENGVILGAIFSTGELPPTGAGAGKLVYAFAHGLSIESDRGTATLSIKGTGKVKVDITGDVEVKCTNAKVEATTKIDLKAPLIAVDGNMTVTGLVTAAGIAAAAGAGGSGDVTIAGNVTVTGDVQSSGDVKAGTISLSTHVHGGVQTGGGSTGVPV